MKIEQFLKTNKEFPPSLKTIVNILVLAGKIKKKINKTLKPYGISEPQFNMLRILRGQDNNSAALKIVQKRMIHKTSDTTRIADRLIKKGYIDRKISGKDRRAMELSITQQGLELLSKIDLVFEELHKHLVSTLDEKEIEKMNLFLEKMNDLE